MVYVLGGYQSDFARNWAREGLSIGDGFVETVRGGLDATRLDADEITTPPAVDANARQLKNARLHEHRHGLAHPEGRRAADLVTAVPLRHLGLARLHLLARDLPGQLLQAHRAVAMHQHDQRLGVLVFHDQRLDDGTYEGWFGKKEAKLDWSAPVDTVYNTIRAANPAPGAWTIVQGHEIKIYDSARVDGTGTPGEVVSVSDTGVTVQANGGRILIKRVREGQGKVAASEWANTAGITVGMTLGQ